MGVKSAIKGYFGTPESPQEAPESRYALIHDQEDGKDDLSDTSDARSTSPRARGTLNFQWSGLVRIWPLVLVWSLFLIALTAIIAVHARGPQNSRKSVVPPSLSKGTCVNPSHRLEWRQLSAEQKSDYISAVKCLHLLPSEQVDGKLSDEFPYVHRHNGTFTHDAAPFLPWHRYLVHLYEVKLRGSCGYEGPMAYWDWSLDWENPFQSPIFDAITGFGGDGDPEGEEIVDYGSCVKDGPFKNYEVQYHNGEPFPHCLSRGFGRQDKDQREFSIDITPDRIRSFRSQRIFFNFSYLLEGGAHNSIPNLINGDFASFDAPNDPIFFLHHTQIDRLWWLWQKEAPKRLTEYNGPRERHSEVPASIEDDLPMYRIGPTLKVKDVLSTESDLLCYGY